MPVPAPAVYIVDDEAAIRDSLAMLLKSVGLASRGFADARSFLAEYRTEWPGCLLLDVRMPHLGGMELQDELNRRGAILPVIFMTAHGDVAMAVEAMRAGAMDFLQKPFKDDDLLRRVQAALAQDAQERDRLRRLEDLQRRVESLTPRELEIARRIVAGQANKVIAAELGLSERTVELHRAHAMQKLEARSVAQLVRLMLDADPETATT